MRNRAETAAILLILAVVTIIGLLAGSWAIGKFADATRGTAIERTLNWLTTGWMWVAAAIIAFAVLSGLWQKRN